MLSEKVFRILRSRTDLAGDQLAEMSEAEAWRLVYSLPKSPRKPQRLSVCFTGFSQSEKAELMKMALAANHHIANSVTGTLGILVCGENAGPKKLEKAAEQGVTLLTGAEYRNLLVTTAESGEP